MIRMQDKKKGKTCIIWDLRQGRRIKIHQTAFVSYLEVKAWGVAQKDLFSMVSKPHNDVSSWGKEMQQVMNHWTLSATHFTDGALSSTSSESLQHSQQQQQQPKSLRCDLTWALLTPLERDRCSSTLLLFNSLSMSVHDLRLSICCCGWECTFLLRLLRANYKSNAM